MQCGNRRQPGAGIKYWPHEARGLHSRQQVDEFEGDVSIAKREPQSSFGRNLGRSGENRLAEDGETTETRTRQTRRRSRPRMFGRTGPG